MINILEIDPVLTVFPYALLYYALLLVSSGLALLAMNQSGKADKAQLQTALIIIFFSQIVLLSVNLLAYQGFQLIKALFPLIHRVVNLVCLLWLVWALFQSREKKFSKWLPIAFTVILLVVGVVFTLWWLPNAASQDFNLTWMDVVLVVISLILIFASAILYFMRFRSRVVEAWLILSIAALGFILYLLLPSAGNLPAAVMLSQVIYYPLLISLASQKIDETEPDTVFSEPVLEQNGQLRANIADAFLEISLQPSQHELEKALTHSLSLYLMADLLGLVRYEPGNDQAILKNTYDLIREDHVERIDLIGDQMPVFFEKLAQGEVLTSNLESEITPEKNYLMNASGYNQVGNLLLYPLEPITGQPRWALLGLSPYTNKQWGPKDLQHLDRLRLNLGKILEKAARLELDARQIVDLQTELLQKKAEVSLVTTNYEESQAELLALRDDLLQTQTAWTDEVNLWINRQKELEAELDQLQQTIADNEESVAEVDSLRYQKAQLEETIARNLEQTAQVKTTIEQASLLLQKLTNYEEPSDRAEESKG